jgi:hypothetical protein
LHLRLVDPTVGFYCLGLKFQFSGPVAKVLELGRIFSSFKCSSV